MLCGIQPCVAKYCDMYATALSALFLERDPHSRGVILDASGCDIHPCRNDHPGFSGGPLREHPAMAAPGMRTAIGVSDEGHNLLSRVAGCLFIWGVTEAPAHRGITPAVSASNLRGNR